MGGRPASGWVLEDVVTSRRRDAASEVAGLGQRAAAEASAAAGLALDSRPPRVRMLLGRGREDGGAGAALRGPWRPRGGGEAGRLRGPRGRPGLRGAWRPRAAGAGTVGVAGSRAGRGGSRCGLLGPGGGWGETAEEAPGRGGGASGGGRAVEVVGRPEAPQELGAVVRRPREAGLRGRRCGLLLAGVGDLPRGGVGPEVGRGWAWQGRARASRG